MAQVESRTDAAFQTDALGHNAPNRPGDVVLSPGTHLSWKEVEAPIRAYLAGNGVLAAFVALQVQRVRNLVQPWLD